MISASSYAIMSRIGRRLFERGLAHATAGNMSVRLDDSIAITASDACLGELEPVDIVHVRFGKEAPDQTRASKALALHQRIYAENSEVSAVLHTHSTHLVAHTLMNPSSTWAVDPITPYVVMKVGPIPIIPYHRPGDPSLPDVVVPWVSKARGVMLERLGPVLWGSDLNSVAHCLDELEETARLMALTRGSSCQTLQKEQMAELRHVFQVRSWNI